MCTTNNINRKISVISIIEMPVRHRTTFNSTPELPKKCPKDLDQTEQA